MNGILVAFSRVKFMNERAGVGDASVVSVGVVLIGEGGGVPPDDGFAFVGTKMEGEHLSVEVFAYGDFVAAFGVWNGEAVGDFDLNEFWGAKTVKQSWTWTVNWTASRLSYSTC